jgi:hypothetical protein
MPTHDYIIANGTGAAVRADINLALSAIVSLNSSASEPATMYAYQLWADTGSNPSLLKIRNGANSAWITLRQLDGDFSIVAVEDGLQATPSLTFTNDLNTGVFRSGADALAIVTGGQYAIACTSTQAVGIKTANPSTALHVAGNARVGADDVTDAHLQIGKGATGNRNSYIDIVGDTTYTDYGLRVIRNNTGANATSELKHRGTGALNFTTEEAAPIVFYTTNSPALTILAGGNVGIGTSSPGELLQVGGFSGSNGITIGAGSSNYSFIYLADGTGGTEAYRGYLQYDHATDKLELGSAGATAVTVDSLQRVGIGTTAPSSRLSIAGTTNTVDSQIILTATSVASAYLGVNADGLNLGTDTAGIVFKTGVPGGTSIGLATGEKARIDSSGRLLVGTSTSRSTYNAGDAPKFQVESVTAGATVGITFNSDNANSSELYLAKARGSAVNSHTIVQNNDNLGILFFGGADGTNIIRAASVGAQVDGTPGANDMPTRLVFSTCPDSGSSPVERMRITNGGFITNKTQYIDDLPGGGFTLAANRATFTSSNSLPMRINRDSSDGNLITFHHDSAEEGSISVSGSTVSYNGAHLSRWSQLPSGADRIEILRGSVLSNLDEMCEWGEEDNEQLNRMKVSEVEGDKNVSGVFQAWDDDDDTYTNDFYCAMTGDFIIRIAEGVTVERGDLLMSAGDGTAKPQSDDIIRSKTVAKVTSTNVSCTYKDGSYCVPCVLMAC